MYKRELYSEKSTITRSILASFCQLAAVVTALGYLLQTLDFNKIEQTTNLLRESLAS